MTYSEGIPYKIKSDTRLGYQYIYVSVLTTFNKISGVI